MNTAIYLILGALSMNTSQAGSQNLLPALQTRMNAVVEQVRACSIIPVTLREEVPVFHALTSQCPEVKVVAPGVAKIKVEGRTYLVSLVESEISDGDLYHVQIKDMSSGEQVRYLNVLAFGDVLLGVLNGNTEGLTQTRIDPSLARALDVNLLKMKF